MKKVALIVGLLMAAGIAAEANASISATPGAVNSGALNAGINILGQGAASGRVAQTLTATQSATAAVNHTGANTIGQTATATNSGSGLQVGSGDNLNQGSAGDSASASNYLDAFAGSGPVSNTAGQVNFGGAFGGAIGVGR